MIAREKHAPPVCIEKSEKSHDPSITVESTSITAYQRLRSTTSSMPYGRIMTKPRGSRIATLYVFAGYSPCSSSSSGGAASSMSEARCGRNGVGTKPERAPAAADPLPAPPIASESIRSIRAGSGAGGGGGASAGAHSRWTKSSAPQSAWRSWPYANMYTAHSVNIVVM